jgi:hypothetical protein
VTSPPKSSLAPRPSPGFESPEENPGAGQGLNLIAATVRATTGVLFVGISLLYVPIGMWTPIMTGVGFMMLATGSLNLWQISRRAPVFAKPIKVILWVFPGIVLFFFLLMGIFGPAAFGPAWHLMGNSAAAP